MTNYSVIKYAYNSVFIEGLEFNPLIRYLQEHVGDGESVYATQLTEWVLKFKNGYLNEKVGDVKKANVFWGRNFKYLGVNERMRHQEGDWKVFEPDYSQDLDKIRTVGKCYVIVPGWTLGGGRWPGNLLKDLGAEGYLHKVGEFHKTPLYYFTTNANDPKRNEVVTF